MEYPLPTNQECLFICTLMTILVITAGLKTYQNWDRHIMEIKGRRDVSRNSASDVSATRLGWGESTTRTWLGRLSADSQTHRLGLQWFVGVLQPSTLCSDLWQLNYICPGHSPFLQLQYLYFQGAKSSMRHLFSSYFIKSNFSFKVTYLFYCYTIKMTMKAIQRK